MKNKISKTQVYLDPTIKEIIKKEAKNRSTEYRRVSMQDLINEALAEYVRKHKLLDTK